MTNVDLYARCNTKPASIQSINARWRLFGHTLRMDENTPARQAMAYYFEHDFKGRQGNHNTIASKLSSELKSFKGDVMSSRDDFNVLLQLANNRDEWKDLVNDITCNQEKLWNQKEQQKAEARKAAKQKMYAMT